jgi:hypothetical protein
VHVKITKVRFELSRWFFIGGVALLGLCAILLIALWIKAAANGLLPSQIPEYEHGKHGPWRYTALVPYVWQAMLFPIYAGCASLLSLAIKPSPRAGWLLAICFVVFFIVISSHFWLVD